MRLQNKVAIVVGAGQTPGDTIGNGRATAILFAREGARVVLVDRIAKEDLIRERDAQVPLLGKMGTAWDVAHAALFLASDEAQFITGVVLPVDGGQSARIG
jgi:NAD(P)-dependent dehydrogenase (short-subunit alcohol dehydrogenase family)